jgi:HSP20 family molecular chaperone IbpA
MKIIFSYHAKKRIYERGIKFGEIRKTIRFPDYIIKKADGKIEAFKKLVAKR